MSLSSLKLQSRSSGDVLPTLPYQGRARASSLDNLRTGLTKHIQQLEELLSIVHRNPISVRLWQFLVFLGQKFGCDVKQGRLIDLQFTHQELAEAINATRVTVTRLLQQFEQEEMLLRHSRRLVLCQ